MKHQSIKRILKVIIGFNNVENQICRLISFYELKYVNVMSSPLGRLFFLQLKIVQISLFVFT